MTNLPKSQDQTTIGNYLEGNAEFQRQFPSAEFLPGFRIGSDSLVGFFKSDGKSYVLKVADGRVRTLDSQVQSNYTVLGNLINNIRDSKNYTSDVALIPILWTWEDGDISIMVQEHVVSDKEFRVNRLDGNLERKGVNNQYQAVDSTELETIDRRIGNFAILLYDFLIENSNSFKEPPFPLPDVIGNNPLGFFKSYDRSNYRNFILKTNGKDELGIFCIDPFSYFEISKDFWLERLTTYREQIYVSLNVEESED